MLKWVFIGIFGVMLLAFALAFIKSWILEIGYQIKKKKAIKNRTDDRWMYEI